MRAVIVGVGSYAPQHVVTNDMLSKVIPYWDAETIEQKLGIKERRFMWPLDMSKGAGVPPAPGLPATENDMAAIALQQALDHAGLEGKDIDALIFVTCTPDEPLFSHDVMDLHQRFSMRRDSHIEEFGSGCGGVAYRLWHARKLIESGMCRRVALVAANGTSPCFTGRHIYNDLAYPFDTGKPLHMALSAYVFGDAAGAVILEGQDGEGQSGFVNSHIGLDYGVHVFRSGGGILYPGNASRTELWRHGYYVDGKKVAIDYAKYIAEGIRGAMVGHELLLPQIKRMFLHQVNKRILEKFLDHPSNPLRAIRDRASIHVDHYANVSAPCTLVLMAEDVHNGLVKLGSGDLVLLAAMGAGVHYGGHLIRL
jgi:3-oxoacyl-[acyl-carrier-protein] synthase III